MNEISGRPRALSLFALPGIPIVEPGDDLTIGLGQKGVGVDE